jgi:lipopolysaccharide export system protein LptA
MRLRLDLVVLLVLAAALTTPASAEPAREPAKDGGKDGAKDGGLFDGADFGNRKDPVIITSDALEYDYKGNVVTYRGDVVTTQGDLKMRSDTLTVTFDRDGSAPAPAQGKTRAPEAPSDAKQRLRQIVAVGNVRIDNGARWATGGRAVFDQGDRTLVLTETPVIHDGSNEVAGDRVVVYLDENRSVVEGGRKRVKAVFHPNQDKKPEEKKP